jgi:hypothetical protein
MNNQTNNISWVLQDASAGISLEQRMITMSLLITFAIPSLICFFLVFYHFFRLRKTLLVDRINHHVILCILISDFLLIVTELLFSLRYLSLGYVSTTKMCLFWIFWDYVLEATSLFFTMYASIERYLLVFHKQLVLKHKLLLHYIPLGFFCFYSFGMYTYLVLLFPCEQNLQYDLTAFVCGGACFFNAFVENIYDTIVDVMLPSFILLIFNLLVVGRVILRKKRVSPLSAVSNTLRKSRRMILQLLAISLMTLITWMPWVIIILGQYWYGPSFAERFVSIIVHYLPYFTSFASPFLALIGLPEIRRVFIKGRRQPTTLLHIIG